MFFVYTQKHSRLCMMMSLVPVVPQKAVAEASMALGHWSCLGTGARHMALGHLQSHGGHIRYMTLGPLTMAPGHWSC